MSIVEGVSFARHTFTQCFVFDKAIDLGDSLARYLTLIPVQRPNIASRICFFGAHPVLEKRENFVQSPKLSQT